MAHSPIPSFGGPSRLSLKRTFEAFETDLATHREGALHRVHIEASDAKTAGDRQLSRPAGWAEAPAISRPPSPSSATSLYDSRASILLVGFAGAGKRTLGIIAAAALRRQYVSFSSFFESHMGLAPYEYMSCHGLSSFRQAEIQITERLLNTCKEDYVIGGLTGLGSAAQREVLRSFAKTNPVIYIQRDKVDIQGMFGDKGNLAQLYRAGDAFYRSSSTLDFFNITQTLNTTDNASLAGTLKLKQTEMDFVRFVHRIFGRPPKLLQSVDPFAPTYTYALQIKLEWLEAGSLEYEKLECGADVISLVIDPKLGGLSQLQDQIPQQMALLRRYTRAPIMIDVLYTRSQDPVSYIRLLRLCFRSAPDFLTVSLAIDSNHLQAVASAKGFTKIVGVIHQDTPWTGAPARFQWSTLHEMASDLSCCAVRVTSTAAATADNLPYLQDACTARKGWTLPLIAYKTGAQGRTSVCFNPILSPVVLPGFQPQGITVTQAQTALYSSFFLSKKKFTILGRSVAYSLSPAMHNAAYAACGMPHSFSLLQSDEFSSINSLLEDEECGGITVSLPFKRKVLPMLDSISPEAREIGAVNTVVVERERTEDGRQQTKLKGHNTDHIGLRKCIERSISPANSIRDGSTALIIGAGGMARAAIYACRTLGLTNICIYNRTLEHAQELADYYNQKNMHIHVLRTTKEPWPGHLRPPTVLASCIPAHSIGGQNAHDLTIPEHWLQSRTGGVFIELAYKPIVTRLIRQMQSMSKSGWITVDGLDVLIEQGIAQFEIFTGRGVRGIAALGRIGGLVDGAGTGPCPSAEDFAALGAWQAYFTLTKMHHHVFVLISSKPQCIRKDNMASLLINGSTQDTISSNFAKSRQTFLIPLTFPDVTVAAKDLERISYGGDVWELRVDLLQPAGSSGIPSKDYVAAQLEVLQRSSDLPVIFTIRTLSQGGKFPETAVNEALELMLLAAEHGCEYIDVEFPWPASLKQELSRRKKNSKLIASFHDWTGSIRWTDPVLQHYVESNDYGDILKLSILATEITDCHELALFVRKYRESHSKPIIAVGMGQQGQLSRVTSPISFVTHPLIPLPSAPGQVSLAEVHRAQHLIGQLPKRNFYIFGNNIAHSLSPTIHNAAFAELGLPHHYSIHETPQMDDSVRGLLLRPDFGGASVTFPHKRNIPPLLDSISESATKLGAVNTVIAQDTPSGRKLRGDNTDWIGIMKCIQSGRVTSHKTGIVIGAGGAARAAVYAYQCLGVQQIVLVNRTKETAEKLAADFASLQIQIYSSLADAPAASVIVACVPADDIGEEDIPDHIFADGPGLLVEMAYRPPVTALMRVAKRHSGWKVFGGVDVLRGQAYAQFELWTGRRAPVLAIEEALDKVLASKI